jgi:transcriptional regulator with XRE-family HTH domain
MARGFTARGLDRRAGLHEGHVAQIERGGIKEVEGATIKKLSDALNIPSAWLGFGEGPSPFEEHAALATPHTASDFAVSDDPRPSQAA